MSGPTDGVSSASRAMERYAAGDDGAFEEVYDALAPRLYSFVFRRTQGDAGRSEDLVQQTFLQMHHARGRFLSGADVVPWAFAIARRLLIDSLRRGSREVVTEESHFERETAASSSAEEHFFAKQAALVMEAELARMPPAQREAFELVKNEGLSMAEAAEALGTTVAAVKLRAHRAYAALRAALGALGERGERGARAVAPAKMEELGPLPDGTARKKVGAR